MDNFIKKEHKDFDIRVIHRLAKHNVVFEILVFIKKENPKVKAILETLTGNQVIVYEAFEIEKKSIVSIFQFLKKLNFTTF